MRRENRPCWVMSINWSDNRITLLIKQYLNKQQDIDLAANRWEVGLAASVWGRSSCELEVVGLKTQRQTGVVLNIAHLLPTPNPRRAPNETAWINETIPWYWHSFTSLFSCSWFNFFLSLGVRRWIFFIIFVCVMYPLPPPLINYYHHYYWYMHAASHHNE